MVLLGNISWWRLEGLFHSNLGRKGLLWRTFAGQRKLARMPELPEVETTRRGIAPHVEGRIIRTVTIRDRRLRWPIAKGLESRLEGQQVTAVGRRGKYLLLQLQSGTLLIHLGMSGSLRLLQGQPEPEAGRHDHVDLRLDDGMCLRFNDPRRFGSMLFAIDAMQHKLLRSLGPEPLGEDFTGDYLAQKAQGRRVAIKSLIMNGHVVVGVGNIYANEALYLAGIHPSRAAGRVSSKRLDSLVYCIRQVLSAAIECGGTTLKDFVGGDGKPGYFQQSLSVYERGGEPCRRCDKPITRSVLGQRASYYCGQCQR
jgi:formamidopyrimidine-DNA glycosylase